MNPQKLLAQDVRKIVTATPARRERIGIEVELSLLCPLAGLPLPYEGPASVCGVFGRLCSEGLGEPIYTRGHLRGVRQNDGGRVTFENGGAIEYCSPPLDTLTEVSLLVQKRIRELATCATQIDAVLVSGGLTPFASDEQIQWMPKGYERILLDHFLSLGDEGSGGPAVMARTTSTQVTLDYISDEDLVRKLRASVLLTPVTVALFANSPIEKGRPAGALCRRMQFWSAADPARSGFIPPVLFRARDFVLDDWIEWVADRVMVYRETQAGYAETGKRTFRQILDHGFPDGTYPTLRDWRSHLCQIYTDVRLRETLELRAVDTPPVEFLHAVPAFFVGLLYNRDSLFSVLDLLDQFSPDDHRTALTDAAKNGLKCRYGTMSMIDVAREVVRLSKEGLRRRSEAGLEAIDATIFISPLEGILASKVTFAERTLEWWKRTANPGPERFVEEFRIPA